MSDGHRGNATSLHLTDTDVLAHRVARSREELTRRFGVSADDQSWSPCGTEAFQVEFVCKRTKHAYIARVEASTNCLKIYRFKHNLNLG